MGYLNVLINFYGFLHIRDLNFLFCVIIVSLYGLLTNSVFLNSVDLKKNMQHKNCKVKFYSRFKTLNKRTVLLSRISCVRLCVTP